MNDPNYTTENLFPLAIQYIWEKKPLREKIKLLHARMEQEIIDRRRIKNAIIRSSEEQWLLEIIFNTVETTIKNIEKEIKMLQWENNPTSNIVPIEQARNIPITDYIQFNRGGFALCLWHNDTHPSLKYHVKRNKVHCFVCSADHDVIDVVMKLHDWDLKKTVNFLTNK